jgi:hypothetical protein
MTRWGTAGTAGIVLLFGATAQATYERRFIPYDVPGSTTTSLTAVNDEGTFIGTFVDRQDHRHGFSQGHRDFDIIDDPDFPPGTTGPEGINDLGDIVGLIYDSGDPTDTTASHGFYLHEHHFRTIDYPGATATQVYGINDFGVMSGFFSDTGGTIHGFTLCNGHFTPFDVPGAIDTFGVRINDFGVVTVQYVTPDDVNHSAIDVYGHYVPADVPGAVASHILGINNSVETTYSYTNSAGIFHAVVRTPGGEFEPIDFPGASDSFGDDVNNHGLIVATYENAQGVRHGYLVLPDDDCDDH